ncbi:hypothetical protein Glove_184g27 [Diversispora epigaea]|uniref:Granulins domain-containing protein n=1 Tax=Diversispora epigaea TaxID=1348612 RepID=A0A397ITS4_9GLOM|nr:hypothetical protein Glove_184g27 [Diversispora epigaea]
MKNLITFVFIIITFINAFDNFTFASSSPANWKRLETTNLTTCGGTSYYYECSNGVGSCTSADIDCSGNTCCEASQYCGSDGYCHTSRASTQIPTTFKLIVILTISLKLAYLIL